MAFKRGSGTVNVELARLQSWVEQADPDLYGSPGKKGVIEEHEEMMMSQAVANQQSAKTTQRLVTLCAIFGAIGPVCKLLEHFHILGF